MARAGYDICRICKWQDDGQDDADADDVLHGPNHNYSLREARENFVRFGSKYRESDEHHFQRVGRSRAQRSEIVAAYDALLPAVEASTVGERLARLNDGLRALRYEETGVPPTFDVIAGGTRPFVACSVVRPVAERVPVANLRIRTPSVDMPRFEAFVALVGDWRRFNGRPSGGRRLENDVRRALADRRGAVFFVAQDLELPVGFAYVAPAFDLTNDRRRWALRAHFVAFERRGSGVGGALLRAADSYFVRERGDDLSVDVPVANDGARTHYTTRGFRERGERFDTFESRAE